jgi:uncharacterized protein (DUF2249 family)
MVTPDQHPPRPSGLFSAGGGFECDDTVAGPMLVPPAEKGGGALIRIKARGGGPCDNIPVTAPAAAPGQRINSHQRPPMSQNQSTPSSSENNPDVVFDVRPIPGRTKHAQIFQRWFDLPVGQHFVLLNDHDPVPLYYQFNAEFPEAFSWEYLERGPEEFRVKITKLQAVAGCTPAPPVPAASPVAAIKAVAGATQEVDLRGLEPPEPLVRILDRLESLPAGATLLAHTDREPCHLFGEAEQRGFRHDCKEQADGSWVTVLTRA